MTATLDENDHVMIPTYCQMEEKVAGHVMGTPREAVQIGACILKVLLSIDARLKDQNDYLADREQREHARRLEL